MIFNIYKLKTCFYSEFLLPLYGFSPYLLAFPLREEVAAPITEDKIIVIIEIGYVRIDERVVALVEKKIIIFITQSKLIKQLLKKIKFHAVINIPGPFIEKLMDGVHAREIQLEVLLGPQKLIVIKP